MLNLRYPGPRFIQSTSSAIQRGEPFTVTVASAAHRARLLKLKPKLEDSEACFTNREMLVLLFGLFRFMGPYFTAVGAGYRVTFNADETLRVVFAKAPGDASGSTS